jgi:uncharacterized protein with GYD domain
MPLYLHQWRYKDEPIRQMLENEQAPNRADFVRTAVEAFSGTLHNFYYALGDCDGVAITEFPDEQTALACVMLIYGQGRLREVRTSTLFPPDATLKAIRQAQDVLKAK